MSAQVRNKYFIFLFCLILPLQILNAQVVIKEKIELKSTNHIFRKADDNIRCVVKWDKPQYNVSASFYDLDDEIVTSEGWVSGGETTVILSNIKPLKTYGMQARFNIDYLEEMNIELEVFTNGIRSQIYSHTVKNTSYSEIPFRNYTIKNPLFSDFTLSLTTDRKTGVTLLGDDLATLSNAVTEPFTMEISEGSEYFHFGYSYYDEAFQLQDKIAGPVINFIYYFQGVCFGSDAYYKYSDYCFYNNLRLEQVANLPYNTSVNVKVTAASIGLVREQTLTISGDNICYIAEALPGKISSGDTASVIIKKRLADGSINEMPAGELLDVELIAGNGSAFLLSDAGTSGEALSSIYNSFRIIANDTIDSVADSLEVIFKMSSGNCAGFGKVVALSADDSVDHFDIQIANDQFAGSNDTLAFTETATLFVKAKDPDGNDISLDENTSLKLSILNNLNYLAFINASGDTLKPANGILTGIPFKDFRDGKIKIAAVKNNPSISDTCRVRIEKDSDAGINGEKKVTILERSLKIIVSGENEVEPLISNWRFDAEHYYSTQTIRESNRKLFRVKLTRGDMLQEGHLFKLKTDYVDGSGGHDHITPRREMEAFTFTYSSNGRTITVNVPEERAKRLNYGCFYSFRSGTTFNSDSLHSTITDTTKTVDSEFEYVSTIWGDSIRIYVESTTNPLLKDSITLVEKIPDLVLLPNSNYYVKIGGTDEHVGSIEGNQINNENDHNHFCTPTFVNALQNFAERWHQTYQTAPLLHINDMSLPNGGKFDIDGSWRGSHKTHRRGTNADIRSRNMIGDRYQDLNGNGQYDNGENLVIDNGIDGVYEGEQIEGFKDMCFFFRIEAKLEYPGDYIRPGVEHWHLEY